MNERPQHHEPVLSCDVCMKEIPESVAQSVESEDYVLHFCGVDCFDRWEKKAKPNSRTLSEETS